MADELIKATPAPAPDGRLDGPVHLWFGLSYSSYLVLNRTLMQSMPLAWQKRIVACLRELTDAYERLEQADAYQVTAMEEVEYDDLTEAQMRLLNVTRPDAPDGAEEADVPDLYYDRDGVEHQGWERALVPVPGGDPVPNYNRGRTFIPPRVEARRRLPIAQGATDE